MERDPFNPSDPVDAMAQSFRLQVTDMALNAYKTAIYRDMDVTRQLEVFVAGALTGLVGVALASFQTQHAETERKFVKIGLEVR